MKWKLKRKSVPNKKEIQEAEKLTEETLAAIQELEQEIEQHSLAASVALQLCQDFITFKGLDVEFERFISNVEKEFNREYEQAVTKGGA